MTNLATRLKELRIGIQKSQKHIAELLNTTQASVQRFESGFTFPNYETLMWYANYFDVSLDYIFGRTDNPHGEYFNCKPPVNPNNEELKEFVEMCFDPESSMNSRLKDAILKMLEEQKK